MKRTDDHRRQHEYALTTHPDNPHVHTILPYRLAENLERAGRLVMIRSGFYSDRMEARLKLERER